MPEPVPATNTATQTPDGSSSPTDINSSPSNGIYERISGVPPVGQFSQTKPEAMSQMTSNLGPDVSKDTSNPPPQSANIDSIAPSDQTAKKPAEDFSKMSSNSGQEADQTSPVLTENTNNPNPNPDVNNNNSNPSQSAETNTPPPYDESMEKIAAAVHSKEDIEKERLAKQKAEEERRLAEQEAQRKAEEERLRIEQEARERAEAERAAKQAAIDAARKSEEARQNRIKLEKEQREVAEKQRELDDATRQAEAEEAEKRARQEAETAAQQEKQDAEARKTADEAAIEKAMEVPDYPINLGHQELTSGNPALDKFSGVENKNTLKYAAFKQSLIHIFEGMEMTDVFQMVNEAVIHGGPNKSRIDSELEPVYLEALEEYMKNKKSSQV